MPRPQMNLVAWNNRRSRMICPKTVLRGFPDICTQTIDFCSQTLPSEGGYSMIESLEKLYGPRFTLAKMGTGSSIRSSTPSWLPATVAPVASRTGWATARTRSIGEGAPAQPARQASLQSRVAGRPDHRKWPRTAPYRQLCAAGSAACWWKTFVVYSPGR